MNARVPLQAMTPPTTAPDTISLMNLAARQRMLSQRLTLQIVLASQGVPGKLAAAEETLHLFGKSEEKLVKTARQLAGAPGQVLKDVYFGPGQVEATVGGFLRHAQEALAHVRDPRAGTKASLDRLVDYMDKVLQALNTATSAFDRISTDKEATIMRELKGIVSHIQSVALEAKVVSFNAQVIAARAGAVGREFAVVANTLASISGQVDTLARKGVTLTTQT